MKFFLKSFCIFLFVIIGVHIGMLKVFADDEADITPPDTFFIAASTSSSVAMFEFSSNEESSTFECNLDGGGFVPCTSPYTTAALPNGEHTFEVRAIDAFLNTDLSPASESWTVLEPIDIWHLNATEGDFAIDSWESDNDGTVTGTPNWTTGRVGNALSFDGETNYITVDRPVEDDFTICAWIKTEAVGAGPYHWTLAPIMDSEVSDLGNDFGFGINNDGYLSYGNGGAFDSTIISGTTVNDNAWHHTCVTRDTSLGLATLYIDGLESVAGAVDTARLDGNASAYIGAGTDGAVPFDGLIDEIFVYNFVLSSEDIETLYEDTPYLLTEVTRIRSTTNDISPIYTFAIEGEGDAEILISGDCGEPLAEAIGSDPNAQDIQFTELEIGETYECTITVRSDAGDSNTLNVGPFTVRRNSFSGSSVGLNTDTVNSISTTNIQTTEVPLTPKFIFTKNLKFLMNDIEVQELQKFLNTHGFPVSLTGPGSLGFETTMFGSKTKAALIAFQKANNITPALGYFGPITRVKVNGMIQ